MSGSRCGGAMNTATRTVRERRCIVGTREIYFFRKAELVFRAMQC